MLEIVLDNTMSIWLTLYSPKNGMCLTARFAEFLE